MSIRDADTTRMRERLRQWLVEEGFTLAVNQDPNARFNFSVRNAAGITYNVLQPAQRKDLIVIGGNVSLSPEHQTSLSGLDLQERNAFLWELKFDLLRKSHQFQFQPPTGDIPQVITISESIWYDGITKDSFMRACGKVNEGILYVLWKFAQRFGTPAPRQATAYQ